MGIITIGIVPRALGPASYGNFHFLTGYFNRIFVFFDMVVSVCFYTRISQRNEDRDLLIYYGLLFAGIIGIVVIGVQTILANGWNDKFWPGQLPVYVRYATAWGSFLFISQIMRKIIDAYALTVHGEKLIMVQQVLATVTIVILYSGGWINLQNFFIYNFVLFGFSIVGMYIILRHHRVIILRQLALTKHVIIRYTKELYIYAAPIVALALATAGSLIFDRWFLQLIGGSVEQGFFSLAFRVGSVSILFSAAMAPLLMREFSKAYGRRDYSTIATLFSRYVPMLYAVAAYFSIFLVVQAKNLSDIIGGTEYRGAVAALAVMSLYPIHQTYGQLSSSLLYSTDRARLYRNIGLIMLPVGILLTVILIGPIQWWGLNLGSTGLALKFILLQFLTVNLHLWFNTKQLNLSFRYFLWHQTYTVGLFFIAAAISSGLVGFFTTSSLVSFLVSGFLYTLIVIAMGYGMPFIFSISREDIHSNMSKGKLRLSRIFQ